MILRSVFLILFLSSCGKQTLDLSGETREFLIHMPDHDMDEKLPVLFVLHGNPSNGWQMKTWTGMNKTAEDHKFIVVYPYAAEKRWPIAPAENGEEIAYFSKLLTHLKTKYPVDTSRLYLSGMSGGGIFSFQLVQNFPNTFAAFAVVSGNLPQNLGRLPAVPFMYVHGTDDFLYPGRDGLYSAEKTIEQISEINACNGNVNEASLSDINVKDKSTVTRIDFDCSTPIVYYRVNGGGHHWPGATFDANLFYSKPLGPFNQDLDTNEAIWQFCAPFRRE